MKTKLLVCSLLMTVVGIVACSQQDCESNSKAGRIDNHIKVSDMAFVGKFHNDAMTAIYEDFDRVAESITDNEEDAIALLTTYLDEKMNSVRPAQMAERVSCGKYIRFIFQNELKDYITDDRTTRTPLDPDIVMSRLQSLAASDTINFDSIPCFSDIMNAYSINGILTAKGVGYATDIFQAMRSNLNGQMTNARFRAFIDHEIATFDNDIYMCTQEESAFIASLLSIADSSGDWWNTHPEANPNQIPAVAVDAGGAIVSGLIGIFSGNASWQGIATSAISASTGAATKVGSVLVKIAKWAKNL